MKKVFVLMAMAIVSLGLTGCGPRYSESSAILYYNDFKNFLVMT
jgi:ABC-type oligopeptide transport system substrate-binding subunit